MAKPLSTFSSGYQTLTRRSTARLAPRKRLRKRLKDPDKEEHGKAGSEEEVESGRAGATRGCPP